MFDRTPPQALDAEKAILGAMMLTPTAVNEARDQLTGPDFYRPAHEWIFEAICTLTDQGNPHDPVAVAGHLERAGHLEKAGGRPELVELVSASPITANVPHWAHLVRDAAESRRIIDQAHRALQIGYDTTQPAADRLERVRALFDAAARPRTTARRFADVMDATLDSLEHGARPGLATPWPDLDRIIYGLQPGKLYTIGARPGIGKSLFAQGLASAADTAQKATYFASLEMPIEELNRRALADKASVRLSSIVRHRLDESDWDRLAPASEQIRRHSMIWVDDGEQTIAQIRAAARTLARTQPLGLIIIDYLQLVAPRDRRTPREQQVAEISREAKLMAKALHVPVVLLAQLNRKIEDRTDKQPMLSDLRESGGIEQDSDVVIFLHPDPDDHMGYTIQATVAKNREGTTGTLSLVRQGIFARLLPARRERTS